MKKLPLFIISGPSGAGEDSVIEGLRDYLRIERVITTTSRPMRLGDTEGNPYFFITRKAFQRGIAAKKFIEYAEQYNGNLYGVTKKEIDRVLKSDSVGIWKIEYKGVSHAKEIFPGIVAIMITAPLTILEDRIRRRGGIPEEQLKERLIYTKEWFKHTNIYDYVVTNEEGKLEKTIKEVAEIIKKEMQNTI
ncbi:MAG: hypothetical protein V1652_04215 [bacterium]